MIRIHVVHMENYIGSCTGAPRPSSPPPPPPGALLVHHNCRYVEAWFTGGEVLAYHKLTKDFKALSEVKTCMETGR